MSLTGASLLLLLLQWWPCSGLSIPVPEFSSLHSNRPAEEALFQWGMQNGIDVSSFEVRDLGGYRGIFATRHFAKSEPVMRLPLNTLMMAHGDGVEEAMGEIFSIAHGIIEYRDGMENTHRKLALFLMHEILKGKNSFWYHYVNTLPAKTTTCVDYTDEQMEGLKGTLIYENCKGRKKRFEEEYPYLFPYLDRYFNDSGVDWNQATVGDWLRAHNILNSRNFALKVDGNMTLALIPIGDLFNHKEGGMGWRVVKEAGGHVCEFHSNQDIQEGEQIFLEYGTYDNSQLLKAYGFLLPDNPRKMKLTCEATDPECVESLAELGNFTTSEAEDEALLQQSDLSFNDRNILNLRIQTRAAMEDPSTLGYDRIQAAKRH